jgi:hypothetical protein
VYQVLHACGSRCVILLLFFLAHVWLAITINKPTPSPPIHAPTLPQRTIIKIVQTYHHHHHHHHHQAMDGNMSTYWDPTGCPAWLELALPIGTHLTAVELSSWGDTTHDCVQLSLQTLPTNHTPNWQGYPAVPSDNVRLEARTPFESVDPMGLVASDSEVTALLTSLGDPPYVLIPEHREFPATMVEYIPARWAQLGGASTSTSGTSAPATLPGSSVGTTSFSATVRRGEHFTFQLAIFVPPNKPAIESAIVDSSDFPIANLTCYNTEGVDPRGQPFVTRVSVPPGHVRV